MKTSDVDWRGVNKKAKYPDFPQSEYRKRTERAARLLKEEDLDALLLTESKNVYYMTGIQHVDVIKGIKDMPPTAVILTRNRGVIIVGRWPASHIIMKETAWPESVASYGPDEDPSEAIVKALKEYGLADCKVGMELSGAMRVGISINEFRTLTRAAEHVGVQIADGSAVVWRLRSVKSDFEIDRLRSSAQATCKALHYAIEDVEIGANMIDLAQRAGAVMMEAGAYWYNTQVLFPPFWACISFDARVPAGYMCFDFSAEYKHYLTDMHRVVLLGRRPTEKERHLYDVRKEANEVVQKAVKPGKPFDEVVMKLKAFVEESGCLLAENYVGHGIGLEVHEPPSIGLTAEKKAYSGCGMPGYPTKFETGMAFTIEPAIQHPDIGMSFNCEDDVVVTETGCEVLAEFPREMRIKV